ncbi:MAG: patatin-like phospholipase family protein [Chloroflexota bacterium]|nr:patatin-like phospholipase family protein [Anaerolineales bacterium]MCA9976224.1 patatin-like phospholipase family protein [Anaerolineales bacterium]MCB8965614.1 patatin-like phospholipase family protein [Ardenticatenaceae bacterium]
MTKIGLALGGGGARGAAHIGVLMELERLGIRPSLITGTSIGGIIGALVAFGLRTDDLKALFKYFTVGNIYGLPGGTAALSTNTKIEKILQDAIGRPTFADLKIPLALVTTDLVTRKEVILDEGDLIEAVLATMALPVIFPPVKRGKHILADGGMLNNVPFDIARARGATYVIAVSLSNSAPYGTPIEESAPPPDVISRALAFTKRRPTLQILSVITDIWSDVTLRTRLALTQPEILLEPDMGTIGIFDTHRLDEGVQAGQQAVRAVEARLLADLDLINSELEDTHTNL